MKKTLFLIFLSFFSLAMQAQTIQLKGTVKDAGTNEELIGVNVIVVGSKTGTVTSINGDFEISVPQNATLKVSYVGYKSQEIKISGSGQVTLNVKLESDNQRIDEVMVVGYNSQKKSSLTGAVSSVNMTDLAQRKVPDVAQMLQGQVAGVQVTQSTGAPVMGSILWFVGWDLSIVIPNHCISLMEIRRKV